MSNVSERIYDDGEVYFNTLPVDIKIAAKIVGQSAGLPLDRLRASLICIKTNYPQYFNKEAENLTERLDAHLKNSTISRDSPSSKQESVQQTSLGWGGIARATKVRSCSTHLLNLHQ